MATAEELLRSIATQPDPEGHIVISGDRFVTVPENLKRLAVQYDHNMETVTFDCPRYWDNHDMSEMAVYINYMLSDGYTDTYPADNIRADGDIMHFDWTISRNVSQVAGSVSFLVCVMKTVEKTDEDGNTQSVEERHWNSELCQECYISKGMESVEYHPALDYPDEVTQLLLRMKSVEQINVQAGEMQTLYANTQAVAAAAEETKNQALDASGYIKNSYAPAIKGNVSGEFIHVKDVSPIEHDVKCLVHSKNLCDLSVLPIHEPSDPAVYISSVGTDYIEVTASPTYDGNGHVHTSVRLKELCPQMRAGKQYILSGISDAWNKCMYLRPLDFFWNFGRSLTVTQEMLDCTVGFYGYAPYRGQEHGVCRISNVQIEEGSVATVYEPYVDPSTTTVKRFGKNLLNPNRGSSSGKGLTLTNHGDGSFTIAGTATSAASFGLTNLTSDPLHLHKGVTYTQSVIVLSGSMTGVAIVPSVEDDDGNVTWNYFSNNQTKTPQKHYKFWGYEVYVENGKTVNLRFKVQLEVGETATEYEPYKTVSTYTPASDGTCVVTSKSPTMTLFTDTPGIIIEAEYNVDTKTYIEQNSGAVSDEDIANAVNAYLEENPVEAVELDTSLSKTGAAADAKAVGDKLGSIESALDSIIAIQNNLIGGDGA